ncbi:MAG: hypothetical protein L0221_15075 [Chloroflexi bacterium]|nr:hypothetical protein [Chloroflexota bacterium]
MERSAVRWIKTACGGMASTLAGLAWDATMHARDPGLAAHEGVLTLSNPSHSIFVGGLVITTVGLAGALAGTLVRPRKLRFPLAAGLLAVATITGGIGAWASSSDGEHAHDATATAGDEGDQPAMHEHRHGSDTADVASATAEQRTAAQALLDRSIAGTVAYRDASVAEGAGYRFAAVEMAEQKLIYHVPNPVYHHDGNLLDPQRPETLLYARYPDRDSLVLVGVVYRMEERGVPGLAIGGPITVWHNHSRCMDPATHVEVSKPIGDSCPEGAVLRTGVDMMHLWFTGDLATAFNGRRPPVQDLIAYQRSLQPGG